MIQLRLLLVIVACSCTVARNMERREEHHHPLSTGDNSTHQHGDSAHPVANTTTVDHRRAAEVTPTSTNSDGVVIHDWSYVLKKLEKELNASTTTALHPNKRAVAPAVANHRAEPRCCN